MSEAERAQVVQVAKTWLGTPYHPHATLKACGVDCLTLLAAVFTEAGVLPQIDIPAYSPEWHLHRNEEAYLAGILQYTREIAEPRAGDVALWRFGRTFSHAAIVIEWPIIIHAYISQGCVLENADAATWLKYIGENTKDRGKLRPVRFFSCWS